MKNPLSATGLALAMAAATALPAAAQTMVAPNPDTPFSVLQADVACAAALDFEAQKTGEAKYGYASRLLADQAREEGGTLGMETADVDAMLEHMTTLYARTTVSTEDKRHARMVKQCMPLVKDDADAEAAESAE